MTDDQLKKRRITIVSAHEGATTWVSMVRFINETTRYEVTSFHEYDDVTYRSARSRSERLTLRIRTFVVFPLRFLLNARRLARDSDLLLVVTSPFFMPVLASWMLSRSRTQIIALMNDIYPEALVAKRILRRDGVSERCIKRVFGRALRKVAALVFISDHHRAFVSRDMSGPVNSCVIPVSAHSDPFTKVTPAPEQGAIDILYCGTLGLMHDTATFLSWLQQNRSADGVRFAFYTSGASKEMFERAVGACLDGDRAGTQVVLGNALGEAEWVRVMKGSQVGLVFQEAGSGKVIFPSKMASILAAGQAVLAVAEPSSDVGRLVLQNDCGWVVEPNDVSGFDACIREIEVRQILLRKRLNAFKLGQSLFGKVAVATRWVELFDSLAARTGLHAR